MTNGFSRARRTSLPAIVLAAASAFSILGCQNAASTLAPGATNGPAVSTSAAGESPGTSPTPAGPADTGGIAAARAAIDATNLDDPASLQAIDAVRFTDEGVAAAEQALEAGVTGDALWAATWIYGSSGTDANVLKPLLATADESVRAMAASTLLSLGERGAARVLVTLISVEGNLRGSHPPLSISAFSRGALDEGIVGPAVAPDAAAADASAAWTTWLDANEAAMEFSAETGRWALP